MISMNWEVFMTIEIFEKPKYYPYIFTIYVYFFNPLNSKGSPP